MRIALLSDVHGNLPAFQAVVADIDSTEVEEVWCLGDLVGYGAEPDACVELARERCDLCLAGNHDLVVTGAIDIADFSSSAATAAQWTRDTIGAEALEFLGGLSPQLDGREIGLYHASPRDPVWEYVLSSWQADECMDLMDERVAAVGHSHVALFFKRTGEGQVEGAPAEAGLERDLSDGEWLINPGGVGQPRDGDPRAAYALYDTDSNLLRHVRVTYDVEAAQGKILAAGLPPFLASRLAAGD